MLTMMSDDQHSKQIAVYNPVQDGEGKAMDKTTSHLPCDGAIDKRVCGDTGNCLINFLPELATESYPFLFVEVDCAV